MKDRLGIMLWHLREKMRVSQADMAEGILSVPVLCRVERGEKEIDYVVLKALFERLGKSLDKLEIVIDCKDYEQICLRDEIEGNLTKERKEQAKECLKKYIDYVDNTIPLHQQYIKKMEVLIQYLEDDNAEKCLEGLKQALKITLPKWKYISRRACLCNQENRLILLIIYMKTKLGNVQEGEREMTVFCKYIQWHYTDSEERVKVYPHATWILGEIYLKQGKISDAYQICLKGKECLIENGVLMPMWKLLQLERVCLQQWRKDEERKNCEKYLEVIEFVYKLVEKEYPNSLQVLFMSSSQEEFVIANELLKELREATGMTQETLCEDICTQETLSRIESGGRSPNKKKLYKMFQRMGVERETYYGFIGASDYELYEKVRLYCRCIPKEDRELAYKLLGEIEEQLDMTEIVNRQFIETARIGECVYKKEMTREQAIEQLERLLYLTMQPISKREMVYRVPFRQEYSILNHMAVYYRRSGQIEKAIQIYNQIKKCYEKSLVAMKYHVIPGLTLYVNFAGYLEAQNMLIEAEQMGMEGIRFALECGRGDILGGLLANLSLVYEKEKMPAIEEKFLKYGWWLAELYRENKAVNILKEAYKEKFEKDGSL